MYFLTATWQIKRRTQTLHSQKVLEIDFLTDQHCVSHGKVVTLEVQKHMAITGIEPATFALLARRSNQLS